MFTINLEIQHSVYTFDTACFYTDEENALDIKIQTLRHQLNENKECRQLLDHAENAKTQTVEIPPDARLRLKKGGLKRRRVVLDEQTEADMRASLLSPADIKEINRQIKEAKDALKQMITDNVGLTRQVRPTSFNDMNIVSIFDSTLTRCLHMSNTSLNYELVIVKVYYFGVAESIIKNGFDMNGDHYVFFSASAGQIRTKKFVAIRERDFKECFMTLSCGLTIPQINAKGGVNINKYLAYLALCNSATSPWEGFPIDHTIVVEDFETDVTDTVDYISPKTFKIARQEMPVPIPHTDGCGMILPSVSKKNFMIRAPWIKGLLASFPFDKFIREANLRDKTRNYGLIKDIYGVEHDVLAEGIQVILTKSQFKMWKFYDSWEDYVRCFKRYGCVAGTCNEEPDRIDTAKFNYQMLQTLVDMTDEELESLCERTNRKLSNISSDRQTMLQVFGATKGMEQMNDFQRCLAYYPELLQDSYCREVLKDLKNSIEWKALAGRLDVDGKYLFLIPDLYAACEHWFKHEDVPKGLLANGEVFARPYKYAKELDVLRSPHLYKEHAIRHNMANDPDASELRRWFQTDGIYTSSHDLISRILQFDVDGDRSLVVAEPVIVQAAKRNCQNVVPLYYEMAKAGAMHVDNDQMYKGMVAAWTTPSIGIISNKITCLFDSPHPDEDAVKILVMVNNYAIDSAKTLVAITPPPEWEQRIKDGTRRKVPHFFIYAKDKEVTQVAPWTPTVVNRLSDKIQSYKFDFQKKQLGAFNFKVLMQNPKLKLTEQDYELYDTYRKLAASLGNYNIGRLDDDNTYIEAIKNIKKTLSQYGTAEHITDVLIKQLFDISKTPHKAVFWDCYGDIVFQNLQRNNAGAKKMCKRCGKRFVQHYPHQLLCKTCAADLTYVPPKKMAVCVDCGREFMPASLHQTRCQVCQWIVDNPPETERVGYCINCGAPFDIPSGKGRKPVLCRRCRINNRRISHAQDNKRRRGVA